MDSPQADNVMREKFDQGELARAIRTIAHGGVDGPAGLEAVAMALSGDGNGAPIGEEIRNGAGELAAAVRDGLGEVAEALQEVASAIRGEPGAD